VDKYQPSWLKWLPRPLRDFLKSRPDYSTIIENSGWLLFDRFVRLLLGLVVGAWVARHLGPDQYGELFFAIAVVAIFQPIASLGMDGIVVRDISQNEAEAPGVLGTVLLLRVAAGLLTWGAATALVIALKPADDGKVLLVVLIGATLLFQAADTVNLWFQGTSQNKRAVVPKLTGYIIGSAAKLSAVLLGYGVAAIAGMYALDAAVAAAGLFIAYRHFRSAATWHWERSVAKRLFASSWPFMLSGLGTILYIRIDQVLLDRFLGPHELGIYAAAIAISSLLPLFPMTLFSSLAPYVAKRKLAGEQAYRATLDHIFSGFGLLALALVVPTTLLAGPLIAVLFGDAYRDASGVLSVHALSNLFTFQGIAQGLWFINENAGRMHFLKTVLGLLLSVAGNIALIPNLGALGAAMVAIAVQFVASVGVNVFLSPTIFRAQMRAILPLHMLFGQR